MANENQEIDMEQPILASEAAHALDVSVRTVSNWLNDGTMSGDQTITGRWRIPVSEVFRIAKIRQKPGRPVEARVRERLVTDILPKYAKKGRKGLAQTC